MVILDENNIKEFENHSSKGNQLKWEKDNIWYKADYTGHEGLTEYIIANLLKKSNLLADEFIDYETVKISYKHSSFNGCMSTNFTEDNWQIITLERLYKSRYNRSFMQDIWKINNVKDRLVFLVDQVEKLSGIKNFGIYINKMLTIDALFLNEDRHLHNIAILMNDHNQMKICPFFDHGAGLLADTTLDYPLNADVFELIPSVKAKTICDDFDEALDESEALFGQNLIFHFTKNDVKSLLANADIYSNDIRNRVETIIYQQMHKYRYLFIS